MKALRFDYDSVLERLKLRVLKKLGGQNLLMFSTNIALLEAVAEEFDDLSLYDEFLTRECVWDTARGTSSIMKQVGFLGYKPHRRLGATGTVRFSASKDFTATLPYSVNIPVFTKVSGGGVSFVTKNLGFLKKGDTYTDVTVVEGEPITITKKISENDISRNSNIYTRIGIDDDRIENTLYEVKVNGDKWEEVDDIKLVSSYENPETAKVFMLKTMSQYKGVEIFFGNGVLGKPLTAGDTVTFTYVKTSGTGTQILSSGVVTTIDSTINYTDVNGRVNKVSLFCTNLTPLMGGDDNETLASIKANAPKALQAVNRAITTQDYIALIKRLGIATNIAVWGEKETNEDLGLPAGTYIEAGENVIHTTGYTVDSQTGLGATLSSGTQDIIRNLLNDKKGMTDILQFIDTEFLYVTFDVHVFVNDYAYTEAQIRTNVHDALFNKYLVTNGEYRRGVYKSDYIAAIDGAVGVDHCTCEVSLHEMLTLSPTQSIDLNLGIRDIKPGSVKLMIRNTQDNEKWHLLAHEDNGHLIGDVIKEDKPNDKYVLTDSIVNHTTGEVGEMIILSGLTSGVDHHYFEIRVDFELASSDGDIVPTKRSQIVAWYEDNTSVTYM